jgi:tetratricopeptide (TPR) repeat protein
MPKPLRMWVLWAPLLLGAAGCDSLKARMQAQKAVELYHRGLIQEAAKEFESAERLDPYIPTIQLDLGFAQLAVYQANPRSQEGAEAAAKAITAFERYLSLRPDEDRARSYLVQTFVDTGHYDEAVQYFKPAVEQQPPDMKRPKTGTRSASTPSRKTPMPVWRWAFSFGITCTITPSSPVSSG